MNALACAQEIRTHLAVQTESLDSFNPSDLDENKDVLTDLNLDGLDRLKLDRRTLWSSIFI